MAGRGLFDRIEAEGWKAIDEIVAERLPESVSLEFKDKAQDGVPGRLHEDDKKNLAKSISAFANTEGGCLIFGVTTERSNTNPDRAKAVHPIEDLQRFRRC